jgi:predicted transcriptional regulator of viral defense system
MSRKRYARGPTRNGVSATLRPVADASNLLHAIDAKGADGAIAELAERQHGVVARRQLVGLGLGRGAIAQRIKRKRLHRIHRGVYAVGHRRISQPGWWLAAVLACGSQAVLSHRSAAVLWGILEGGRTAVDVSVPRQRPGSAGIRVRVATIAPDERTVEAGIPVTTVARTLLDLAADLQLHELHRALERAEALRLADSTSLDALIERHPRRSGVARLRAATRDGIRAAITRSELERRFLTFVERAGLPAPRTNVWLEVGGDWIEVDCVWREQRVIVELDSRAFHQTSAAFERDRRRDRRAQASGWRVIRVTERAMRREGRRLRTELTALIAAVRSA